MLAEIGDDELLEGAGTQRAVVAVDRERYDLPVERGTDQIGGHLPLPERAVREIVEWRFARGRLVDPQRLAPRISADLGQGGVVGAGGHQPPRLDPALAQQLLLRLAIREPRGARHY